MISKLDRKSIVVRICVQSHRESRRTESNDFLSLYADGRLREIRSLLEAWLFDQRAGWLTGDEEFVANRDDDALVPARAILQVLVENVCTLAGHMWLEYSTIQAGRSADDLLACWGGPSCNNDRVDASAPIGRFELLPDVVNVYDRELPWNEWTITELRRLLEPFLSRSPARGGAIRERPISPAVSGFVVHDPPGQLRMSEAERRERSGAFVSPLIGFENDAVLYERADAAPPLYSFTPEYYAQAHNCVTFVTACLSEIAGTDWAERSIDCPLWSDADLDFDGIRAALRDTGRVRAILPFARVVHEHRSRVCMSRD